MPPPPSAALVLLLWTSAWSFSQLAQNVEMWASRWECVIRTFFTLERFSDVKDAWKRGNAKVRARFKALKSLLI